MSARNSSVLEQPARLRSAKHGDLYVILLLILAWAPIPIGSNRGWSLALLEAGTLFIMGVWALRYTYRPFEMPLAIYHVRHPLFILALWIGYPLIQMIPVSLGTAEIVGGGIGTLYVELPPKVSTGFVYLTLDRNATFAGFVRQCSLVALLFSILALVTSASRLSLREVCFHEQPGVRIQHHRGRWNRGWEGKCVAPVLQLDDFDARFDGSFV